MDLRFQPHPRLIAGELQAALLAEHPAAGRPGRGRAARGSDRPELADACLTIARWIADGRPFSAGAVAGAVGLSRPTIVGYLGVWSRAGLLERVDDAGQPVALGTPTAPGTSARWRLASTAWTPQRAARMPAEWGARRALAWACLRLGASDEFVGGCIRRAPAANGDRALMAWYRRATGARHRHARREARAVEVAAQRADRGRECSAGDVPQGHDVGAGRDWADEELAAFDALWLRPAGGNLTPPRTEHSPSAPSGPSGRAPSNALAREARRGKPARRVEPSADQLRQVVEIGQARDDTEAASLWADVARAAELVGEDDPVAVWGQAVRIAATGQVRHRRRVVQVAAPGALRLGDQVGRYQRAVDRVRADIIPNAEAVPVTNAAALACHWWRRDLVEGETAVNGSGTTSENVSNDVGDQVAEPVEGPPAPALYVPEPEPERRLTAGERRAIRERVEAERQRQQAGSAAAVNPSPEGRLAALLARARAERPGRTVDSVGPVPSRSPAMSEEPARA